MCHGEPRSIVLAHGAVELKVFRIGVSSWRYLCCKLVRTSLRRYSSHVGSIPISTTFLFKQWPCNLFHTLCKHLSLSTPSGISKCPRCHHIRPEVFELKTVALYHVVSAFCFSLPAACICFVVAHSVSSWMIWSTLSRHSKFKFVIKHMVNVILKLDEDVMAAIPVLPAWCHDALHVDFLRALLASSVPHPSYTQNRVQWPPFSLRLSQKCYIRRDGCH